MLEVLAAAAASVLSVTLLAVRALWPRRHEEHPQEWIFSALAYGRRDLVVKGDPDMNWNEAHPHFGTPLHAIGGKGIRLEVEGDGGLANWTAESNAVIKDLLALFEFAMRRGADPTLLCPLSCTGRVRFKVCGVSRVDSGTMYDMYEPVGTLYDMQEPVGGRSAVSLWLAFAQRAKELDHAYADSHPLRLPLASSFFDGILSLLLHEIPKHKGCVPKGTGRLQPLALAEVPEATAGLWQRIMRNDEACDVILQCPDGEVGVHSVVAGSTSKVLAAMLKWPRDEKEASGPLRVPLEDRKDVLEAWRTLVYTGLPPPEGLTTELLLDVLDLSHRWQDHLIECGLLTTALAKRVVDGESCGRVLDAALAKDIPELRSECLAFARRSREVRRDWERGQFSGEVCNQLGSVLGVRRRGGAARAASTRRWDL